MKKNFNWVNDLLKRWKITGIPSLKQQPSFLKKGIQLLAQAEIGTKVPLALAEQPFDRHLLEISPLFRESRKEYLDGCGRFLPTLVSSSRTLSSAILLEQRIEYSPIESELIWAATDPVESRNPGRLLELRSYASSLFHEQNHRILWRLLPQISGDENELRRFLNFAESLVIASDMALGDELGPGLAPLFYLIGVTYDPGTSVRNEILEKRQYRNYLQAVLHATYMNLEFYDPKDILKVIRALFPVLGPFADRAVERSGNLDRAFIHRTNLNWQKKHQKILERRFCEKGSRRSHRGKSTRFQISEDPMNSVSQYLFAETWFERLGF